MGHTMPVDPPAAHPHFRFHPAGAFGASYAGGGAMGSPYGYGTGHFGSPPGHYGYGNYAYSGYPGRVALPSYPYTGYPGPHHIKDSGTYAETVSGRHRLG